MSEYVGVEQCQLPDRRTALDAKLASYMVTALTKKQRDVLAPTTWSDTVLAEAGVLTYGEYTHHDPILSEGIPGLPEATPCVDPEIALVLAESHLDTVEQYIKTGTANEPPQVLSGRETERMTVPRSGHRVDHLTTRSPEVAGYRWYAGLKVPIDETSGAVILIPRIGSGRGGSPLPMMYSYGNPEVDDLRKIAGGYADHANTASDIS